MKTVTYILTVILTVRMSLLVSLMVSRKNKSIDMLEALKCQEQALGPVMQKQMAGKQQCAVSLPKNYLRIIRNQPHLPMR